jgi:hypothetical protein
MGSKPSVESEFVPPLQPWRPSVLRLGSLEFLNLLDDRHAIDYEYKTNIRRAHIDHRPKSV